MKDKIISWLISKLENNSEYNYIPDKNDAKELGFKFGYLYWELPLGKDFKIQMVEGVNTWLIYKPSGFGNCIKFDRKEDVKTLIRILNK